MRMNMVVAAGWVLAGLGCGSSSTSNNTDHTSSGGGTTSGDAGPGGTSSSSSGGAQCDAAAACQDGTCCLGHCANLATSFESCGACGNPCQNGQVCLSASCHAATLASACLSQGALVLLDGVMLDDYDGRSIGMALDNACSPFEVAEGHIDDQTYVAADSHLPVKRAERLVVSAGGPFVNAMVGAFESNRTAPIYFDRMAPSPSRVWRSSATNNVVLQTSDDMLSETHDYFVVETFREMNDDRLVLTVYGLNGAGTHAARVYLESMLIPNGTLQNQAWRVMEWTDSGNNGADSGDTFTEVASGN